MKENKQGERALDLCTCQEGAHGCLQPRLVFCSCAGGFNQSAAILQQFIEVLRSAHTQGASTRAWPSRSSSSMCCFLLCAGGFNQSAAISQQFIEVLADLPWSRSSADAAQEAAAAAAAQTPRSNTTTSGSSAASPDQDAGVPGGSGDSGSSNSGSSPYTPPPAAAARHRRGGVPKLPRRGMVHSGKPGQNGVTKGPRPLPENIQGELGWGVLSPPTLDVPILKGFFSHQCDG
eukprot:1145757-Pelagomonas_calceolata.AAC.6